MKDILLFIILILILGLSTLYIYKEKKKGARCIGCPYSKDCSGNCEKNKTV